MHSATAYENTADSVASGGGRNAGGGYENFAVVGGQGAQDFLNYGEHVVYVGFLFGSENLEFSEVADATHETTLYMPAATTTSICEFAYSTNRTLLSLLWRPTLPAGWSVQSASGDGGPQVVGNEILFSGALTANPIQFSYVMSVPGGEAGVKEVTGEVEFHFLNKDDPSTVNADPDPVVVICQSDVPEIGDLTVTSNQYVFSWNGVSGINYSVDTATNLLSNWRPLLGWTDVPGVDAVMSLTNDFPDAKALFMRVRMHQ